MTCNNKALTGLRIAVGALFLIFGEYKVFGRQFTSGGGFQYWIHRFLEDGAYPFMAPVLRNFVLPHAKSIAFLVAYGELAIGLTLAFGVCTARKCVRPDLHAHLVICFKLPGSACCFLAILRRFVGPPCLSILLR